jgi:hypothetical protein
MRFNFIEKKPKIIPLGTVPKITSIYSENNEDADFYDFSDGAYISDEEKQEWIKEVVKYLNENIDEAYCRISCGDSMVIGLRHHNNSIEIIVVNSYMEATIDCD